MNRFLILFTFIFLLASCTQVDAPRPAASKVPPSKSQGTFKVGNPYKIMGKQYHPQESYDLVETGIASWYGPNFHGKRTANGEIFDKFELTAAHRTLQMPSLVRVTNLDNGKSLIVRVNDRGPYKKSRVIDVSERAAELLGFKNIGTAKVKLEVLKQESLQIAAAAKSGQDTSGFEVALNQGGTMPATPQPAVMTAPVVSEPLYTPPGPGESYAHVIPGHTRNGEFYPDPIVTERPVTPTEIFVQVGSFTVPDNAYRLSAALQQYAPTSVIPATVHGRQFYRVRVGPASNVDEADRLMGQVVSAGHKDAIIIVD